MSASKRVRGSIWKHPSKKKGFGMSIGAYSLKKGDRHFVLKPVNGGRTRVYESPQAAKNDGWEKQ